MSFVVDQLHSQMLVIADLVHSSRVALKAGSVVYDATLFTTFVIEIFLRTITNQLECVNDR
jgi:hypothetical protein